MGVVPRTNDHDPTDEYHLDGTAHYNYDCCACDHNVHAVRYYNYVRGHFDHDPDKYDNLYIEYGASHNLIVHHIDDIAINDKYL